MAIFVDEIREYPVGLWCHMWSDTGDEELDQMARILGLKKSWSHTSHGAIGRFYHYDLRPSKRERALNEGATFKPLSEWIKEHTPSLRTSKE